MKIYLLDKSSLIVQEWRHFFGKEENVEICNMYLEEFLDTHEVECIVSPANSYGLMDGGYDLAISEYFGWELERKVQEKIMNDCYGEQLVGTSIIVDIPDTDQKLIHTPSMRVPSTIKDSMIVYYCTRATLICALQNNIKSIVIPAFGGSCGRQLPHTIAYMMHEAYRQIMNPPDHISWEYAERSRLEDFSKPGDCYD